MRAVEMSFAGRLPGQRVTNKDYGTTALQKLLSWGLEVDDDRRAMARAQFFGQRAHMFPGGPRVDDIGSAVVGKN